MLNDQPLPPDVSTGHTHKLSFHWLAIRNVQSIHAGTYKCIMERNYEVTVDSADLIIEGWLVSHGDGCYPIQIRTMGKNGVAK